MHRPVKKLQFSLANALRATTWLCVSAGSYAFLASHRNYDPLASRQWPHWMPWWLFISLVFLIAWSPIVAVGALLGHTKGGMVAGLGFVVLLVLVALMNLPRVQ
jgi:hypothetical protein